MRASSPSSTPSGLRLTALGLGCAPLGGLYEALNDDGARATVEAALDVGVAYFDTAPLYGYGLSEQRLGEVLGSRPRESFVISTKVGRLVGPRPDRAADDMFAGDAPGEAWFDFSRDAVLRSLEESLGRLRLDGVDIVFIHDPDDHYAVALEEACRALEELRDAGTVSAIGVGMNQHEMLSRFVDEADIDIVLCAGRYTLLDQSALGLLSQCAERLVSVVIGGAFNSGVLANPSVGARYDYAPVSDDVLARAKRLDEICRGHDVPLTAVALQFPAHHPAVASVLTGVRSEDQMRENASAFEQPVPVELWQELVSAELLRSDAPVPASAL